ncbi:hypothetical protein JTE90_026125 [Oedothorax gibbosus]|uniref:Uncharacterized protein n=1 Tax=Oedothorax gibbosus TaxID=931172 RepID=A0AAV6UZD7_9ARAC|nr:hypothetical protein JTE90_026125 [Oedothorax gibbosus]
MSIPEARFEPTNFGNQDQSSRPSLGLMDWESVRNSVTPISCYKRFQEGRLLTSENRQVKVNIPYMVNDIF